METTVEHINDLERQIRTAMTVGGNGALVLSLSQQQSDLISQVLDQGGQLGFDDDGFYKLIPPSTENLPVSSKKNRAS